MINKSELVSRKIAETETRLAVYQARIMRMEEDGDDTILAQLLLFEMRGNLDLLRQLTKNPRRLYFAH